MRLLPIFLIAVVAVFMPAVRAASGPSVGHPLSPVCDFICGGRWEPGVPVVPDQFFTTYSFNWNSDHGAVSGLIGTTGGFAGINTTTKVTYGYDAGAEALTVHIEREDKPPMDGTVELLPDGYRESVVWPPDSNGVERTIVTTYRFPAADQMMVSTAIASAGRTYGGAEELFVRKPH